jgi:hypothetical protein
MKQVCNKKAQYLDRSDRFCVLAIAALLVPVAVAIFWPPSPPTPSSAQTSAVAPK